MKKLNFDKEQLIKHRFWVGLGISVPLSLVAILILAAWIPADIQKARKGIEKNIKEIGNYKGDLRNESHNAAVRSLVEQQEAKKAVIWAKAYREQDGMFLWPTQIESKYGFNGGLFAVEIKLSNAAVEGADSDRVFHGKYKTSNDESVTLKGAKGEEKTFYRTAESRLRITDQEGKRVEFPDMKAYAFATVTYERWKYFNDPLTPNEQAEFKKAYESYEMISEILKQVDPVREDGAGVVQLKDWSWEPGRKPKDGAKFLVYHPKEWTLTRDISEEAWIVMEDLWIQKEIYRLIRVANDYVGACKPNYIEERKKKADFLSAPKEVKKEEGPKADEPTEPKEVVKKEEPKKDVAKKGWIGEEVNFGEKIGQPLEFQNPYWNLKITLVEENGKREKLAINISNRLARRQRLDINFMVRMHKSLPAEKIFIPGEPLAPKGSPGDSVQVTRMLEPGPEREGVFAVEQVLNWESAAVKRIDHIAIGTPDRQTQGHRNFPHQLRAFREAPKKDAGDGEQPGKGPPPIGKGGDVPLLGKKDKGADNAGQVGPNGIQKVRYLEVSEQSRRVPVAISLIVDQDHVDRVQTAFGNSRLRFLTTQVLLSRYPSSVRPVVKNLKAVEKQPFEKGPIIPGKGVGGGAAAGGSADLGGNVELVLYGIVTLYERYPPRVGVPIGPSGP